MKKLKPYRVKTNWLMRAVYPKRFIWRMPAGEEPSVYLTFDDGPHPVVTPFVLEQLERFGARATFFCVGRNVSEHPELYRQLLEAGHTAGNHTHNHKNGWRTPAEVYLEDIRQASGVIDSRIFRPPYGKISRTQAAMLAGTEPPWDICMWDVLSGDFDTELTPEECYRNLVTHTQPGSIVVFHDSVKAWPRLSYALPKFLEWCREQNWKMKAICG